MLFGSKYLPLNGRLKWRIGIHTTTTFTEESLVTVYMGLAGNMSQSPWPHGAGNRPCSGYRSKRRSGGNRRTIIMINRNL